MKGLSPAVARERQRCAREVYELGRFSYEKYKDEPAQWIRLEQAYRGILRDTAARFDFTNGPRAPKGPR